MGSQPYRDQQKSVPNRGNSHMKALRKAQTWPVRQEEIREAERVVGNRPERLAELCPTGVGPWTP